MAYQVRCGPGDGGNLRTSRPVTNSRIHHQDDHPIQMGSVIIAGHFIPVGRYQTGHTPLRSKNRNEPGIRS
jgi:hypothetical protein